MEFEFEPLCSAPRPMCQVSSSYSLLLPCHLFACHAFHIMSSCASHLHTCSSHASEHFPRCLFLDPTLLRPPAPPFASFHVWVLNFLRMDQDLPSSLGLPPVDRLSIFVPFGVRLIIQQLTEEPSRPCVCCGPTPLLSGTMTHPNPPILLVVRS